MSPVISIWRDSGEKRLSTHGQANSRVVKRFTHGDPILNIEQLRPLVTSGEPFDPVFVSVETAIDVLGWDL